MSIGYIHFFPFGELKTLRNDLLRVMSTKDLQEMILHTQRKRITDQCLPSDLFLHTLRPLYMEGWGGQDGHISLSWRGACAVALDLKEARTHPTAQPWCWQRRSGSHATSGPRKTWRAPEQLPAASSRMVRLHARQGSDWEAEIISCGSSAAAASHRDSGTL